MDRKLYDYILHGNLFDRFITEFSTGFLLRISPNYKKIRILKPGQKIALSLGFFQIHQAVSVFCSIIPGRHLLDENCHLLKMRMPAASLAVP